jgi:uncharacterized membrane protein YGL010W
MLTYLPFIFGTLACIISFVTLFKNNTPSHFKFTVASLILVSITAVTFFLVGDVVFGLVWTAMSVIWLLNVTLTIINRRFTNPGLRKNPKGK